MTATKEKEHAPATTALALVSKEKYIFLRNDSDFAEALQANLAAGEKIDESVFIRVPTPTGGGTTWKIGDEETKEIRGILVYSCRRGVLWPATQPAPGTMPVLISHDLDKAEQSGPIPADMVPVLDKCRIGETNTYRWADVYRLYGGKGTLDRRAKEQRVLFILREGDNWPLIVAAQPGSLKTVRPFVVKLPIPHWRAVISLTLTKATSSGGIAFAQIQPKLVGELSREDGLIVKSTWTDVLAGIAKDISIEPVSSEDDE